MTASAKVTPGAGLPTAERFTEQYQIDTANLCAAAAARGVRFPRNETVFLGRTTRTGLLTVARNDGGADNVPWVWFLTDCCAAAAKGGDGGIYCKHCYDYVDSIVGDVFTVKWHGDVEPPTDEDKAFVERQFAKHAEEAARRNAEIAAKYGKGNQ